MQKSCGQVLQHQIRSKTRFRTTFGSILGRFWHQNPSKTTPGRGSSRDPNKSMLFVTCFASIGLSWVALAAFWEPKAAQVGDQNQ